MKKNSAADDFFEKQFSHREYINTSCGLIETVDIKPLHNKVSLPTLFAPGWRETPELMKDCLEITYKTGRRIISLNHSTRSYKMKKLNNFPAVEVQKAKTLLDVIKEKNIPRVDIITHSEGAINVAIAATLEPKKFRNLILVSPAGLIGPDSLIRLLYGFTQHILASKHPTVRLLRGFRKQKQQKKAGYIKSLLLALQEGKALTTYDIHPLLVNLRKQGIKIAVVAGENDTAFPLEKMKKHFNILLTQTMELTTQEKENFGFDIFATKKNGHQLFVNSEENMKPVLEVMNKLEKN